MDTFAAHHKNYTKINTLYKRDEANKIILGDYSRPEIEYMKDLKWDVEEKIDGTNIFWFWDGHNMECHGKTVNAQFREDHLAILESLVTPASLSEIFPPKYDEEGNEVEMRVRIYGELYGKDIQKCGKRYIPDGNNVLVFDVLVDNWWLEREAVIDVANKLGLKTCPYLGQMTIPEAEEMVKKGFKSAIAADNCLNAEGVVMKPIYQLFNRRGERVCVKIKTEDYKNL